MLGLADLELAAEVAELELARALEPAEKENTQSTTSSHENKQARPNELQEPHEK